MQELISFSAFLYQYIEFLYSLRLPGGGAIAPLAPLTPPLLKGGQGKNSKKILRLT